MINTRTLSLILLIVFVSFLGFITENIFTSFRSGIIDNRNMIFPFLLGYGLAVFAIYKLFGTPHVPLFWGKKIAIFSALNSALYYFLVCFACVSLGELILGHLVEWTCKIQWWNYSSIPLHITRYTSVPTSAAFSLFITLFMKYLFYPLLNIFEKMNHQTLALLALTLIVLISIDFVHSGLYMLTHQDTLQLWKIELKKPIKEFLYDMKGYF